jgi:hypothetical protein
MQPPDDMPEELEGDFRAGEIRDTRTAPECVQRHRDDLLAVCRKAEPILDQYIDDQCERGDTPTDVAIVLVEMRHAIARAEAKPCPPN